MTMKDGDVVEMIGVFGVKFDSPCRFLVHKVQDDRVVFKDKLNTLFEFPSVEVITMMNSGLLKVVQTNSEGAKVIPPKKPTKPTAKPEIKVPVFDPSKFIDIKYPVRDNRIRKVMSLWNKDKEYFYRINFHNPFNSNYISESYFISVMFDTGEIYEYKEDPKKYRSDQD